MCVVVNIAEAAPSANAGHLLRDFFQVDLQLQTAQSAGITNINTVGNVDDAARTLTNTYVFDWNSFKPERPTTRYIEGDWVGKYSYSYATDNTENVIPHPPAPGTDDLDHWPSGGELYDVEALYLDNDANYIYLAVVTSVPFIGTYAENPATSCSPSNTFTGMGTPATAIEGLIGLGHCPNSNISSTIVKPGDIALDLGIGTPRAERNGSSFRYDYGIDLIHENRSVTYKSRNSLGTYTFFEGVTERDQTLGNQLYKTKYDAGGVNTTNQGNMASDWYTSMYVGHTEGFWEQTNIDPIASGLTSAGAVETAYYKYDFPGGIKENGADTWVIEAVIPRHLFGADNPAPGSDVGFSWVEGCRNDGNEAHPVMRLFTKVIETSSLGNYVWVDSNNDGLVSAGEPPVPDGVVVELLSDAGNVMGSTTTQSGHYLFDNLNPGNYKVRIPASQFGSGGLLAGYRLSSGAGAEANADTDGDNNNNGVSAADPAIAGIETGLMTLGGSSVEPVGESTDGATPDSNGNAADNNGNMTLDIGVRPPVNVDISLDKAVDKVSAKRGETLVYTLTVSNSGSDPSTGVQITDTLPAGVTWVQDDGGVSNGTYNAATGIWSVGNLAKNESKILKITARVN